MRIWTRKSALIQLRPSLGKSDGVLAHRGGGGMGLLDDDDDDPKVDRAELRTGGRRVRMYHQMLSSSLSAVSTPMLWTEYSFLALFVIYKINVEPLQTKAFTCIYSVAKFRRDCWLVVFRNFLLNF